MNPTSTFIVTHKDDGLTSLEANVGLWQNEKALFTLFLLNKYSQTATKREFLNKIHLRTHADDNKIFSIGVEDWDLQKRNTPDVVSATGVYGAHIQGYKAFFAFNAGYRLSTNAIAFHKWGTVLKAGDFNTILELGFEQKNRETKNVSTGIITKESYLSKNFNVLYDTYVNSDLRLGGDLKLNLNDNSYDLALVGDYRIDPATVFKARVDSDNTAVLALNHNYRGLVNFGIVAKVYNLLTIAVV